MDTSYAQDSNNEDRWYRERAQKGVPQLSPSTIFLPCSTFCVEISNAYYLTSLTFRGTKNYLVFIVSIQMKSFTMFFANPSLSIYRPIVFNIVVACTIF